MGKTIRQVYLYDYTFTPADRTQNETKKLRDLKKGERIISASFQIVKRSEAGVATSTYKLGDGADDDGYVGAANTDQAAGVLVDGAGALFANSGGKLFTADGALNLIYTAGTYGAVTPSVRVRVAISKVW